MSILVHFLRVRNLICPLITIFSELVLFHGQSVNMNSLQSKLMHQSNAQLVPTILYGLAAIMLYATYERYLMEIRLIFDYLTLSLRCTRGLSPLEEQTYICEAINLHACRETMVLEQREKADRDLKEMLRKERDRINRERLERARQENQRLQRIEYVNNLLPQFILFLRTVFGLHRVTVDEDNIPPSIRTGMEKQKDELRICAAKTMCCNIQRNFKDKNSILPNCLQGISRGKINLCDIKGDKDLCTKTTCGINGGTGNNAMSSNNSTRNQQTKTNNLMSCFNGKNNTSSNNKKDNCMDECKRQGEDQKLSLKKEEERSRKEQEKCERDLRTLQIKQEKEEKKRRLKEEKDCEENNDACSIFNDLPRTELVMNCEIKRVLDADCQEVLRCKEVIVPPPNCGDKAAGGMNKGGGGGKRSPSGPRSPVGQPFGTATNCNNMGMGQRLQPMYQCANQVLKGSDSYTACSTSTGSCSTLGQSSTTSGVRGRQMDGLYSSMTPPPSSMAPNSFMNQPKNNICGCGGEQSQAQTMNKMDDCQRMSCDRQNVCSQQQECLKRAASDRDCCLTKTSGCAQTKCLAKVDNCGMSACQQRMCNRGNSETPSVRSSSPTMPATARDTSNMSMMAGGPGYSVRNFNKSSVQAIPVQVTLSESVNYPTSGGLAEDPGYRGLNGPRTMGLSQQQCSGAKMPNSFSNGGAAIPIEAQTDEDPSSEDQYRKPRRNMFDSSGKGANWINAQNFLHQIRHLDKGRCAGARAASTGPTCGNNNCQSIYCGRNRTSSGNRGTIGLNDRITTMAGMSVTAPSTASSVRSSSMGTPGGTRGCYGRVKIPTNANDTMRQQIGRTSNRLRQSSQPQKSSREKSSCAGGNCEDTGLSQFKRSMSRGCEGKCKSKSSDSGFRGGLKMHECESTNCCQGKECCVLEEDCCNTGLSRTKKSVRNCDTNCSDKMEILCRLKGGAEEPPDDEEVDKKGSAEVTVAVVKSDKPVAANNNRASSPNKNKLTETKREVFKTVTNIDDPSGKVIRKECDTVIEEILHSSAVPGETKTLREVKVETNIIQEANKTIREESHNTREEIINFEMDDLLASATNDFENRKQRLDMMRRMSTINPNRHVSEERHIYGRLRASPDLGEVQSEAEARSRVVNHRQGGLKGGEGADKRSHSELSIKSASVQELKPEANSIRAQSVESTKNARHFGRGDFCREITERLENSSYGQEIRELKEKLVHLSSPEEMHKTLEKIVLLQVDALLSFVPLESKMLPRDKMHFDPDLSYNALMKELKSAVKSNNNAVTVTRTIKDMDKINAEIERDMKKKLGTQQYKEKEASYPNHYAFAHLIRELRDKIKDYEEGALSSRSEEECENQEQRRQRIAVLRDELAKRKQMLGKTPPRQTPEPKTQDTPKTTSDRIKDLKKKVEPYRKDFEEDRKSMVRGLKALI